MKRKPFVAILLGSVFALGTMGCGDDDSGEADGGTTFFMTSCGGGYLDPDTELCWQDPPSTKGMNWYEATGTAHPNYNPDDIDYCGDLDWGGHTDWRMPEVDELISLIRGCVDGAATGDMSTNNCGVYDPFCLEASCDDEKDCDNCKYLNGPGAEGCYWDPALSGVCSWYWSSSIVPGAGFAWLVYFNFGFVICDIKEKTVTVRCVRDES